MISEFLSIFKSIFSFINEFKYNPLKTLLTCFIVLSIILVKPIMYYATLYKQFCQFFCGIFICMAMFFIIYILLKPKFSINDYDHDTIKVLMIVVLALIVIIPLSAYKCDSAFYNILINDKITKEEFFYMISHTDYIKEFYNCIFSNIHIVLLYSIEFIQTVSITYMFYYILKRLVTIENSIEIGFYKKDYEIILINLIIIIISAPFFYEIYADFWNKIF